MPKRIRDALFLLFIAFFIIGTVVVSLYATGYKIELSWPLNFNRLLIKTGIVSVKSDPEGATIYLNGRLQKKFSLSPWNHDYIVTPAKVKNVLPGEYTLSLEKIGYKTVDHKIRVTSGQTTFAENISLFKSSLPLLLTRASSSPLLLSPSGHYIYISSNGQIINTTSGNYSPSSLPPLGHWLKDSDTLLAGGKLFDSNGKIGRDFSSLIGSGATDWYYDPGQNRVYYLLQKSLNYWDISSQNATLVINGEDCLGYQVDGDNIFIIADKNGQTFLQDYSLRNKKVEQEAQLPPVGQYHFETGRAGRLAIYDSLNDTLYLIDAANISNNSRSIQGVISWQWLDDQTIIFNNNWEIYRLDLESGRSTLLLRVGQKISKIIWNSDKGYLIYITNDGLNTYDPETGLSTKIFGGSIVSPILNSSNNTVYFWTKIGHQSGIYSLALK